MQGKFEQWTTLSLEYTQIAQVKISFKIKLATCNNPTKQT